MIYKEIELVGTKGRIKKLALFDTGSTYSLIRKDIAENVETLLKLTKPIEMQTAKEKEVITATHRVAIDFYINGYRFDDLFIVAENLTEEVIIGLGTLQKWHMKLDIENKEVIIDPRATRIIVI
jgi:predicted aspartyl protease